MKMQMSIQKSIVLASLFFGVSGVFAGTVDCAKYPGKQCAELDVVVRDFKASHPDFENFSEEATKTYTNGTWKYTGYTDNDIWVARRADTLTWGCGNTQTPSLGVPIGTDAYPKVDYPAISAVPSNAYGMPPSLPVYLQQKSSTKGYVWYGEYKDCQYDAKLNPESLKIMRGYAHELCNSEAVTGTWTKATQDNEKSCTGICKTHSWSQIVYTTPGMVETYLKFDPALGEDMMYEPTIVRQRSACDNQFFEQWYTDVPSVNLRSNTTLQLPLVAGTKNTFEIDYNWNNGGYFPLDSVDANMNRIDNAPGTLQWGAQSLSIFCPPYQYQWASSQQDYKGESTASLCQAWKDAGGPRFETAAFTAASKSGTLGLRHLRNYGFTMMGYAKFKYNKGAGEIFEFAGDDDMWIFVDGVMVVDLGGTHLAAPGKADMDYLSSWAHGCHADQGNPLAGYTGENENCNLDVDGTWKNGSWHHLHFFYADRQTDGSNMKIHSTLSELAKSRYGQPAVGSAVVKVDDQGVATNSLFLNTTLSDSTAASMVSSGAPSIIVIREVTDPVTGAKTSAVYGYIVNDLQGPTDKGADGILYQFSGTMVDLQGNVIDGGLLGSDRIAFNAMDINDLNEADARPEGFSDVEWTHLKAWSAKMTYHVTASSGKSVEGFDPKEDWAEIKYTATAVVEIIPDDPGISRPDFTVQAAQLSAAAGSNGLAEDMTADMVLTSIPAVSGENPITWASDNADKIMLSPQMGGTLPTVVVDDKGRTVGGLLPSNVAGLNAGTATTLCYNDGAGKSGQSSSETCSSFSFVTTQPFRVNIRVFDHLGNFVNQFNKSVTGDDFKKALGPGKSVAGCEGAQLYGETGAMLANIKVYPVSQDGRQLATGPYIYQMTIVMESYEYCYMAGGNAPTIMNMPYMRTTETYRRGYRRSKN